jgi:hypothetical protein
MQKAMLNRQQVRQRPVVAPPLQTVIPPPLDGGIRNYQGSPAQPTPPSQHSSPSTARSPRFALQGGMTSPVSDIHTQHPQRRPVTQSSQHSFPSQPRSHMRHLSSPGTSQGRQTQTTMAQSTYYPPSFQKHYDQLGKLTHFFYPFLIAGLCSS